MVQPVRSSCVLFSTRSLTDMTGSSSVTGLELAKSRASLNNEMFFCVKPAANTTTAELQRTHHKRMGKMLCFHRSTGLVVNAAFSRADRCERRPHTNSWVAGVVSALQALALGVEAAPLVSALLRFGAAAACRTEAVAAVPSQHRTGLSQNSCRTDRGEKDYYDDFRKQM